MLLKRLQISNFKKFSELCFDFKAGFNLLLGSNGVGKTTILEAAAVAISGFLAGMEDVSVRNIYKDDVRYQIIKDSNGTPNKLYSDKPTEIISTLLYEDEEYIWSRSKKDASRTSRTSMNPKDILKVLHGLVNNMENRMLPLFSYQSASKRWISARSDVNEKKRKQLHDRRCGYLGCLDRTVNLQLIYDWCKQMEWNSVKTKCVPGNYEMFAKIISKFMSIMNDGEFSGVSFQLATEKLLYMENGEFKEIEDLSAGYQSVLNMVIDLAYRVAILNPDAGEKIPEIEGIVLIDEIDSNLQLEWQWRIVDALTETFPNVQFIAATHSPIIVSSCKNACIISIDEKQGIQYIGDSYAFSVNDILKSVFGCYERPKLIIEKFMRFYGAIDAKKYTEAEQILEYLENTIGKDPELASMRVQLDLEQL